MDSNEPPILLSETITVEILRDILVAFTEAAKRRGISRADAINQALRVWTEIATEMPNQEVTVTGAQTSRFLKFHIPREPA